MDGLLFERVILEVYITLRWIAGASYLDISASKRIIAMICERIYNMMLVLDRTLPLKFTNGYLFVLSEKIIGFARGLSPLMGFIAGVDGLEIKIK